MTSSLGASVLQGISCWGISAISLLLLALGEVALNNGIDMLISNYEPHMKRIYQRAGAEFDELGRTEGFGRFLVCCGAFEVSPRVLEQMRSKIHVVEPLYRRPQFTRTGIGMLEAISA